MRATPQIGPLRQRPLQPTTEVFLKLTVSVASGRAASRTFLGPSTKRSWHTWRSLQKIKLLVPTSNFSSNQEQVLGFLPGRQLPLALI